MYRMHMLLPERFTMKGADGRSKEEIATGDTTLAGARTMMVRGVYTHRSSATVAHPQCIAGGVCWKSGLMHVHAVLYVHQTPLH